MLKKAPDREIHYLKQPPRRLHNLILRMKNLISTLWSNIGKVTTMRELLTLINILRQKNRIGPNINLLIKLTRIFYNNIN